MVKSASRIHLNDASSKWRKKLWNEQDDWMFVTNGSQLEEYDFHSLHNTTFHKLS